MAGRAIASDQGDNAIAKMIGFEPPTTQEIHLNQRGEMPKPTLEDLEAVDQVALNATRALNTH